MGYFFAIEEYPATIGPYKADDHIESGCLPGTVRTEESDDFISVHGKVYPVNNTFSVIGLDQRFCL